MFDNAECNVVGAETWMCGGKIKIARKLPQLSPDRRPQVNESRITRSDCIRNHGKYSPCRTPHCLLPWDLGKS